MLAREGAAIKKLSGRECKPDAIRVGGVGGYRLQRELL